MHDPKRASFGLVSALFLVLGCSGPRTSSEPVPDAAIPPGSVEAPQQPANRDRHGMGDVERYIGALRSDDRVAGLKVPEVVAALGIEPDDIIADVGCGPGVFSLPLARAAHLGLVFAADVEPRQLDQVRAAMKEQGLENIIPVLSSYDDPHLPPAFVDLIFIADTYHHFEHRAAYLAELKEDLAPHGRLALVEYKSGDIPVGPPADHKLPAGQMAAELRAAGFERIASFDFHEWHDFEIWQVAP